MRKAGTAQMTYFHIFNASALKKIFGGEGMHSQIVYKIIFHKHDIQEKVL